MGHHSAHSSQILQSVFHLMKMESTIFVENLNTNFHKNASQFYNVTLMLGFRFNEMSLM